MVGKKAFNFKLGGETSFLGGSSFYLGGVELQRGHYWGGCNILVQFYSRGSIERRWSFYDSCTKPLSAKCTIETSLDTCKMYAYERMSSHPDFRIIVTCCIISINPDDL